MCRQFDPLMAFCTLASVLVVASLYGGLSAVDDSGKNKNEEAQREEQAKKVQRSAAQYTISPADDRKKPFNFHETPVMKWGNPIGGAKDGAIFIWSDRHRPQAICKLFSHDGERFTHEWVSLAEGPIVAERGGVVAWNPSEAGVTFREFPDAPKPGDNAATRLRQMKSLAEKINATVTRLAKDSTPTKLRLLIQPLFRFETGDKQECPDGALFGFAEGTDPAGLLMLETRRTKDGDRWHYAFTKISTFAIAAELGGKEIYSVSKYNFQQDPKETFLALPRQAVPAQ
jgi:hypothetical protein